MISMQERNYRPQPSPEPGRQNSRGRSPSPPPHAQRRHSSRSPVRSEGGDSLVNRISGFQPRRPAASFNPGIFQGIRYHFHTETAEDTQEFRRLSRLLSQNGGRGQRNIEDANIIFVFGIGPIKDATLRFLRRLRSFESCLRSTFDREEILLHYASRTDKHADENKIRRKCVVQPEWIEASIRQDMQLQGGNKGRYEIRYDNSAGRLPSKPRSAMPAVLVQDRLAGPSTDDRDDRSPRESQKPNPVDNAPKGPRNPNGQTTLQPPTSPPQSVAIGAIPASPNQAASVFSHRLAHPTTIPTATDPRLAKNQPPSLPQPNNQANEQVIPIIMKPDEPHHATRPESAEKVNSPKPTEVVHQPAGDHSVPVALPNALVPVPDVPEQKPDIESLERSLGSHRRERWRPPASIPVRPSVPVDAELSRPMTPPMPMELDVEPEAPSGRTTERMDIDEKAPTPVPQQAVNAPAHDTPAAPLPNIVETRVSPSRDCLVFARPPTMHVVDSTSDSGRLAVLIITRVGGGLMTSIDRASYIIIPEAGLREARTPVHERVIRQAAAWQAVVSIDWVEQSIAANRQLAVAEYEIRSYSAQSPAAPTPLASTSQSAVATPVESTTDAPGQTLMTGSDAGTRLITAPHKSGDPPRATVAQVATAPGTGSGHQLPKHTDDVDPEDDDSDDVVFLGSTSLSGKPKPPTAVTVKTEMFTPPLTPASSASHMSRTGKRRVSSSVPLSDITNAESGPSASRGKRKATQRNVEYAESDNDSDYIDSSDEDDHHDAPAPATRRSTKIDEKRNRSHKQCTGLEYEPNAGARERIIREKVTGTLKKVQRFWLLHQELEIWGKRGFQSPDTLTAFFEGVAPKHNLTASMCWDAYHHWTNVLYKVIKDLEFVGSPGARKPRGPKKPKTSDP